MSCRSTELLARLPGIDGDLWLKQHKGQISTAQERNTHTRICSDSHKSARLPRASLPRSYSNSQVVPSRGAGKKNSKPRKGAVEAQQIHRGSSSQLPAQKSSAYSSVCLHTAEIKKKIKKQQNPARDNVLTAVVKIKGNLQTLPASKSHTFIPKVSSHPTSRALLLFKSALQRTSLRNLRGFGGHQKYPAHPL